MRDQLTELEECVVGVVWRDGPLTAYEIALTFATSLSSYWSGSAGAIYPLVKRLQKRGLLKADRARGGPQRTLVAITPAGMRALRTWLRPPLDPKNGAPSFDPVRTRLYFIEALRVPERRAFLDDAEQVIRLQLAATQEQRRRDLDAENLSEAIGTLGGIYELRARLRWLRAIRKFVLPRD